MINMKTLIFITSLICLCLMAGCDSKPPAVPKLTVKSKETQPAFSPANKTEIGEPSIISDKIALQQSKTSKSLDEVFGELEGNDLAADKWRESDQLQDISNDHNQDKDPLVTALDILTRPIE